MRKIWIGIFTLLSTGYYVQAGDDQYYLIIKERKTRDYAPKSVDEILTFFNDKDIQVIKECAKSKKLPQYFLLESGIDLLGFRNYSLALRVKRSQIYFSDGCYNQYSSKTSFIKVLKECPIKEKQS